jgi:hypothetical protein
MVSMIDIAAMPADGWHGAEETRKSNAMQAAADARADLSFVGGYREIDDLIAKVNAALAADPDLPCLRSLEIRAHGNPVSCDDFQISEAAEWGRKLKTLKWCDEGAIYLSGCNTGLTLHPPRRVPGPLAEALAQAMAVVPGAFENHITVYGSAGYKSGSRAEGNLNTILSFTQKTGAKKTFWGEYPGARATNGDAVWDAFPNW